MTSKLLHKFFRWLINRSCSFLLTNIPLTDRLLVIKVPGTSPELIEGVTKDLERWSRTFSHTRFMVIPKNFEVSTLNDEDLLKLGLERIRFVHDPTLRVVPEQEQ